MSLNYTNRWNNEPKKEPQTLLLQWHWLMMLRGHWVLQPFQFHHPSYHKVTLDRKYVCLCVHKKLTRIIPWFCICKFTYLLKCISSTKPIVAALSVTSRHAQCSKAFRLLSMCTLPGKVKQGDTLRSCYYTIWSEDVNRKGQRTSRGCSARRAGSGASWRVWNPALTPISEAASGKSPNAFLFCKIQKTEFTGMGYC